MAEFVFIRPDLCPPCSVTKCSLVFLMVVCSTDSLLSGLSGYDDIIRDLMLILHSIYFCYLYLQTIVCKEDCGTIRPLEVAYKDQPDL